MGLFDRFKKQNKQDEQEIDEAKATFSKEKEEIEDAKKCIQEELKTVKEEAVKPGEPQRFTMLVEDCFKLKENQGFVLVGNLHGILKKNDAVYIIHPSGAVYDSKVEALEVGPGRAVERAENEKVAVQVKDLDAQVQIHKFTVLTGIKPQNATENDTETENPQLLGLSMEYPQYYQDSNYLNLLIYVLVHTNYVVPVHLDESVREKVENIAQLKDKSVLRFPSLQNHNDPNLRVFPVFTDSVALDNWKTIFNEEHPKYTMLLKFNEILQICNKTGIVINPFGPVPIPLTPEQIQQIVNLEGYKSEFGEVSQVKTPEEPAKQEAKLMIGVPKETEEIRLMKEAIIAHAKTVREIQRVDFLLKVDAQKERAYLCIVDCPKEDAAKFFTGIHKAATPYLNEVKRLEFLLFGKTKLASDVANEKSCIYEA